MHLARGGLTSRKIAGFLWTTQGSGPVLRVIRRRRPIRLSLSDQEADSVLSRSDWIRYSR